MFSDLPNLFLLSVEYPFIIVKTKWYSNCLGLNDLSQFYKTTPTFRTHKKTPDLFSLFASREKLPKSDIENVHLVYTTTSRMLRTENLVKIFLWIWNF